MGSSPQLTLTVVQLCLALAQPRPDNRPALRVQLLRAGERLLRSLELVQAEQRHAAVNNRSVRVCEGGRRGTCV